jgi:hypothetical protein
MEELHPVLVVVVVAVQALLVATLPVVSVRLRVALGALVLLPTSLAQAPHTRAVVAVEVTRRPLVVVAAAVQERQVQPMRLLVQPTRAAVAAVQDLPITRAAPAAQASSSSAGQRPKQSI